MSGVMEGSVDFSNQAVQTSGGTGGGEREWRRFKGEQGKSYRIRFTSQQVEMRHRHYNPQDKRYYRCLGHTGYCPVCMAAQNGFGEGQYKLKKAQETFGANILVYNTDAMGNVIQPLNAEVYFWAFGPDKFVQIRDLQTAWGGDITKLDLKVTCTDGQFQRMSIINLPNCLYESDANFKAACDVKISKDSYPLAKMMCQEVDLMKVINVFKLPDIYIPKDMLNQMPQGQQTVSDYANGIAPQQSVAPQVNPVQQNYAPNYSQSYQMPNSGVSQQNYQGQSSVQPTGYDPTPAPQVAPQGQVPTDAYADLSALQDMLG